MATAVETAAPSARPSGAGDRLLPASILAAAFLLLGIAAVGYAIPRLFATALPGSSLATLFIRVVVQIAALVGIIYLGGRLAGANPPRGIRGGIFVVLSTFFTLFFLIRAIGLNFTTGIGQIIGAVLVVGLLFLAYRFLVGDRARRWMLTLEDMGLFHTFSYKKTQGLRMRRYTIAGILLVGLSGVWTMMSQNLLGTGDLTMRLPFINQTVAVLADKQYAVPLLLAAAVVWFAWRSVNIPSFADFLIATEAEMNKVSWTPKKRLLQDTIVVLVTTLLLTAFLLVIDLFWGWLLSLNFIGVLPSKEQLNQLKSAEPITKQADW